MSRPRILGNWKMHHSPESARAWCRAFLAGASGLEAAVVGVFPGFPSLPAATRSLGGSPVGTGAQTCHWEREGAFTGEVSPAWLEEVGCRWVLVGHSERRAMFGESEPIVRRKLGAVLQEGLQPVLCIGELLEEREAGRTEEVLRRQLASALEGEVGEAAFGSESGLLVAYEPVWAIGTGVAATPEQAEEAHRMVRATLVGIGGERASGIPILYGGSVKPANVADLMERDGVDGALVGGASLDPATFAELISRALEAG